MEYFGIPNRRLVSKENIAFSLASKNIEALPQYLQLSLRLQEHFGLRREESAKIIPLDALSLTHLKLTASWTKGGRERSIPIENIEQGDLIADLEDYVGTHGRTSLIPPNMSYRQYLSHRQHHLASIGIGRTHGLLPRKLGGPLRRKMTEAEKQIDTAARLKVSSELGHSRIGITRTYLG